MHESFVVERIAARNGHDNVHKNVILCATCGERERAPGRTVCSRCKERERPHEKPRRMMYPVQALSHNPTRANGITAVELLALRNNQGRLDADDLELWLLGNGLAIRNGKPHLLVPTSRAH